jgi:phytoene synthase
MRVDAAYQVCAERVNKAGSSFYHGMRLLPPRKRMAIYAVYAWSRICDDAVDDYHGAEAAVQLERAANLYARARADVWAQDADPVTVALGDAIRSFHMSEQPFRDFLAGMRMDLLPQVFKTFSELELYCQRVAGTIGTFCVEIFGYTDKQARDLAVDMGIALQLTNILRDLKEDADRGRIYLPRDDMHEHGVRVQDIISGYVSPQLKELLAHEAERAHAYYTRATGLFQLVEPDSLPTLQLLYDVYYVTLQKIEQAGYDVWNTHVRVSQPEKLKLVSAALWQSITG